MNLLENERWWGGRVADGQRMPFSPGYSADLGNHRGNQAAPLLVSSRGRVAWSDESFVFGVSAHSIESDIDLVVVEVGETLRDAVLWAAANRHHVPRAMPDAAMFAPQWALWIEQLYEPTQASTLSYARSVIANGYSPGVIMIDDNWSNGYSDWTFRADRFPDPRAMVDDLHAMGFTVMLWVCPYVGPDGINFLSLRDQGLLLRDADDQPAIRKWWNGYSAVLDLTNDETVGWFRAVLRSLQEDFGVDGFKFDGADPDMYRENDRTATLSTPSDQVHRYGRLAAEFDFNELRSGWNLGGYGLAMRLHDANHSWDEHGIAKLIPDHIAQGLLGMPFGAPDMIGGGQYLDFDESRIDPEVFVRHAQVAALCPMMQFSAAPWRLLDDQHAAAVRAAADLRAEYLPLILDLADNYLSTGDPILRALEYEFPHQGLAHVNDCFMLGPDLLVAPVLERGATSRRVVLPPGQWTSQDGRSFGGGQTIEVPVELTTLPLFHRQVL